MATGHAQPLGAAIPPQPSVPCCVGHPIPTPPAPRPTAALGAGGDPHLPASRCCYHCAGAVSAGQAPAGLCPAGRCSSVVGPQGTGWQRLPPVRRGSLVQGNARPHRTRLVCLRPSALGLDAFGCWSCSWQCCWRGVCEAPGLRLPLFPVTCACTGAGFSLFTQPTGCSALSLRRPRYGAQGLRKSLRVLRALHGIWGGVSRRDGQRARAGAVPAPGLGG